MSMFIIAWKGAEGVKFLVMLLWSIQGKRSSSCPFAWFSSFFSRGVRKERDLGNGAAGWLVAVQIQEMIGPNDDDYWEEIAALLW